MEAGVIRTDRDFHEAPVGCTASKDGSLRDIIVYSKTICSVVLVGGQ
jgi:hypothetical protein